MKTVKARRRVAAPAVSELTGEDSEIRIGLRLRHQRLVRGLRLRELADTLGCSESFLSKVENEKVRPSLTMLHRIVGALGTNIPSLFADGASDAATPVQIVRAKQNPMIHTDSKAKGPGVRLERRIATTRGSLLEANIHCVDPGGHTDGVYTHEGEEIGYVLQGQLELQVNGVRYTFAQGDSFSFRSDLPHGYRNPGSTLTKVLWVNTPPTF